jgi:hypothetical protein
MWDTASWVESAAALEAGSCSSDERRFWEQVTPDRQRSQALARSPFLAFVLAALSGRRSFGAGCGFLKLRTFTRNR